VSTPDKPRDDPFPGWAASVAVSLLALFLRLWQIGTPRDFLFDETYYAKDAWALVHFGYVRPYVEGADELILNGTVNGLWTQEPSLIVHPEVGKWLIGLGELAFGMDTIGWRVAAAAAGSLMVLVMCRLALRLTGSVVLASVAGLLMTFDGLHLTLSRIALLDIFVAFFLLLGVHLLVMDRDWFRARLDRHADGFTAAGNGFGPVRGLLFRPWLVAAGVSFGLAVGTKWAALYPMAAFGLLVWLWSAGARRARGLRWPVAKSALVDGVAAFVQLVLVALVVYVASWTGWLIHAGEYEEHKSSTQYTRYVSWAGECDGETMVDVKYDGSKSWPTASEPDASGPGEVVQSLRSLWYYHQDVLTFHRVFLNCATHDYASHPGGWLLVNRGVSAEVELDIQPGEQGCDAPAGSDCLRQVLIIGNPVLWWGSLVALAVSLVLWVGRRDWRHGLAVVGVAASWLPWLMYAGRTVFNFYAILALPFLVLSATLVIGELLGRSSEPSRRRTLGVVIAGSFFVLVVVCFAWFWPIWTDGLLTHSEWLERMWFGRWV
jgi:dolichyl-phosphate-mannose--protein O-mannosyl transferase